MSLGISALSDAEKAAMAAVKSKAEKGAGRSYMGQLHSSIADAGENLGMSKKVASIASGIGMAGAGIGAFSIANNTSENHPFLGGAAKIGIIAGAGYAALKGHGTKAIGEALEGEEKAAADARIIAAVTDANHGVPPTEVPKTGGAVAGAAQHVDKNHIPGAAAVTPPAPAPAAAVNTHGAVPVTTPPPVTVPPVAGVVNADNGSLHNSSSTQTNTVGATPVGETIGTSQGDGTRKVSDNIPAHGSNNQQRASVREEQKRVADAKKAKKAENDAKEKARRAEEKAAARAIAQGRSTK